ncbi:MAG: TIM barrel protein [Pirellulaceae bacterium]
MPTKPEVILSGFADESAINKTAEQQFSALAALGLEYYSIRFIDAGNGIKNVMELTKSEISKIRQMESEYGLNVSSLGSPIGKVKLKDVDDGSKNRYVPFAKYLKNDVNKACELAHAFETKLIRGFSFYHPIGTNPADHISEAVDHLGQIAEACHRSDLTFGLEVEANLIGQNGDILAEIHKQVKHPAMMLIFDAGNLVCQGYTPDEVYDQYLKMKPGTGWMHVKDYKITNPGAEKGHVDEEALKNFVPTEYGDSAYDRILRDFSLSIPKLEAKLKKRGIPGVFMDMEPHVKGGGQFGGFSGPDGFGVALRSFCKTLDYAGVGYHLRDFDDIIAARGF